MNVATSSYREHRISAQDGLGLNIRDYGDPLSGRTPLLCLTGLTRNAKDYHAFAQVHAPRRRVVCPDYRGRGRSGHDPEWRNYRPEIYVQDALAVMTALGLPEVVLVGTSLGGILGMALSAARPTCLKAMVLNDIGPELKADGASRIAGYVGKPSVHADFADAGRALKAQFERAFPDLSTEEWTAFAERTFIGRADGQVELDYDLNLGLALAEQAKEPRRDLWMLYAGLKDIPTLSIRGALSDLFSAETQARMKQLKPDLETVVVGNRGHVPMLDEPPCVAALGTFLDAH
ncbi:MAG: alpha/beta hydrolase [Alphaproteobacteria bacterium]|nr:alpha/beta hydrolase [Alphaproteobacteria bacterium]